ncbi:GntR family transcriptional regulator [Bacillus sonorensis]|uniref:GntR family transcriptional regulator n=1 Tax=Bacillus sonorensis TaxID=119858 RepID=UPI000496A5C5|nr:GntR family transcriptional regulator [Bacillus sonorensis]MBG9917175.1 GntR family transcriptional regulator [Bacillus sonorensis]MCF7618808.1 GntR family transcriptional regulator [Bacillus sonorensis]MCY7855172.1 GntR family transcriptional regulator [Bacillus sonorensis]MCY8024808.1 GntR family transcriptional regulator [Bacillus sonorensis]MCY8032042.1 GntR family transcriptional regulator [Bacillus sonorensis]
MSIKADNQRLCLKVIDRIKDDIEKGVYRENEQLPSEFELSKLMGVSRGALREALRVLEDENVIIRRHGVGTFVNAKPLFLSGIEQLNSVTKMIEQASMTPGTIFMSSQITDPTEEDLLRFQNADENGIFLLERVRTANGAPVVYCLDKIPMTILPKGFSHEQESMFEWLEHKSGAVISYAVADIVPIGYHDKISQILECDPETALLLLKQIHYDQHDRPVLYSLNYFRADKFRFHVVRKRF